MITENIVISKDFSWIDIENPLKADFDFIEEEFNLPPLLVQDCLRPEHLPKYEKTQSGFFFMLRLYDRSCQKGDITIQKLTNKLAIFVTESRVVTIHNELVYPVRKFAELREKKGFPSEVHSLTYQILRICIISFEDLILKLQKEYEEFEKEILSKDTELLSNTRVYEFRRKLYVVRGILELTQHSLYHSASFWSDHNSLQQDVRENIDQIYFRLEGLAHNFDQLFALHLSINEQKSNDVMKILTVFASIMLPLTFIASFYGMNFDHIPGLHTTTGFVGAIVVMATTTFVTVWFFNKRKWFKSSV